MAKCFDVFLSHNSKDKPAVRELAEALRARGLNVWLDEWELVPGQPWQEALEEVIETTRSSAVLVGKDGLGPWQDAEMRGCLSEFVARKLPVIPVLLPGAPEVPRLPLFLKRFTWVDLRGGLTEEGLDRLQWGVTGKRPDHSAPDAAPEAVVATESVGPLPRNEGRTQEARREARQRGVREPVIGGWKKAWWGTGTGLVAVAVLLGLAVLKGTSCVPGELHTENGIDFVRICPGTFIMGSAQNDLQANPDEKPAHQVTLSEFWLGKTEITNEQYRRFRSNHQGDARLPATISWADAKAACEHFGGRLPTEAEWEYAARAGSQTAWSFGDNEKMLGEYAWYGESERDTPHPGSTKKPNAWGLYDMHGNVWEWVADWYGTYPGEVQPDPTGPPTGEFRVLRGGAFNASSEIVRSAVRGRVGSLERHEDIGFRCARGTRFAF